MKRVFGNLSALVGLGGMLFLASSAAAQQPGTAAPPITTPTASMARPAVAVFNIAAVMRDYDKAKYQIYLLSKMKAEKSGNLLKLRSEHIAIQQRMGSIVDPAAKEKAQRDMLDIQRRFEDEERMVNKNMNDYATQIISRLYEEIKTVVDKTAEMNSYDLVFAYPDATTPEDQANPIFRELKLRPSAALPFFVSKRVDMTSIVVSTLNAWYPPTDEKGVKVDVKNLPPIEPPQAPGTALPNGAGRPAGAPVGAPMGLPAGAPMGAPR
ncbi:MAG TPA: OmpH family outer membrane protein [Urbifossiella sp.]